MTKTDTVLKLLSENPTAGPKEIAALAAAQDVEVTPGYVSAIKQKNKSPKAKLGKRKYIKRAKEPAAAMGVTTEAIKDPFKLIAAAKDLIHAVGSADKAKQLIDLLG